MRKFSQLIRHGVKWKQGSTDQATSWWEQDAESLENIERLPDWQGFLELDINPAWQEKHRERVLRENGIVAQIVRYIERQLSRSTFQYSPLDSSRNEIRLLQLDLNLPPLPRTIRDNVIIEVKLETFPAEQCPEYCALSYTWGSDHAGSRILVNGQLLNVTNNLDCILQSLHTMRFNEWIWIDAISINQTDNQEKSVEVQRMRSIYHQAVRVLGWTGYNHNSSSETSISPAKIIQFSEKVFAAADSVRTSTATVRCSSQCQRLAISSPSDDARNLMTHIFQRKERSRSTRQSGAQQLPFCSSHFFDLVASSPALLSACVSKLISICQEPGNNILQELYTLLSHPIWTRIWILQEFQSAREVMLVWQNGSVPLEHLIHIWAVLYLHPAEFSNTDGSSLNNAQLWMSVKKATRSMAPMLLQSSVMESRRQTRSLFELLRATGSFEATDPRDRIFALLGISKDAKELGISPDYSKSYRLACIQLTKALLRKYGMSVLSFNAGYLHKTRREVGIFFFQPKKPEKLPSWCCDWSLPSRHAIVSDRQSRHLTFAASSHRSGPLKIAFNDEKDTLALSIVQVGLATTVSMIPVDDLHGTTEETVRQFFAEIEVLASEFNSIRLENNWLEEALFCIPIAYQRSNKHGTGNLLQDAPDDLVNAYQILRVRSEASISQVNEPARVKNYLQQVARRAQEMKLFSCNGDYLGLGPKHMQKGDMLAIIEGADVPFILRQQDNKNWRLIGEAYVHGIMYGEFMSVDKAVRQQIVVE